MTNTDKLAARMARADEAFTKHVVEGRSLRDLAPEMGVSYETVRSDVAAFRSYLAEANAEDLASKRAGRLEELRDLKAEMGVSYETVRSDVAAFRSYLAEANAEDLASKRAGRLEELRDLKAKALFIYERFKDSKPLTAVGALNTAMSAFTHIRAIEGLDMPKEAKVEGDIRYTVTWEDDGDDAPQDAGYGEGQHPLLTRLTTKD